MKNTITTILVTISTILLIFVISRSIVHNMKKKQIQSVKEIDVEKLGKNIGDIRRKFLKGYRDTTTVKIDSLK